jgi:hypothetical protein
VGRDGLAYCIVWLIALGMAGAVGETSRRESGFVMDADRAFTLS